MRIQTLSQLQWITPSIATLAWNDHQHFDYQTPMTVYSKSIEQETICALVDDSGYARVAQAEACAQAIDNKKTLPTVHTLLILSTTGYTETMLNNLIYCLDEGVHFNITNN